MALNITQYNSIMRRYERRQVENRRKREERLRFVYENIEGYQEMDESVASISVAQGKKLLAGDTSALDTLKQTLAQISAQKESLLLKNGLPADYLEPLYQCPHCKDTGYFNGQKCHCFKQAEIALLYEQAGLTEVLQKENFDTLCYEFFQGDALKNYMQTVEKCRKFAINFNALYQNLFFYGTVGTGKTFLTNCIARECIESGNSVIYFSAANLFDTLARSAFDYKSQDEHSALCSDLNTCDLLIIDDLGTENISAFTLSRFFTVLNERMLQKKSIIISTNLSLEDFQKRYQDRIFSRITSSFDFIKLTGPDIRMQKKKLASRK